MIKQNVPNQTIVIDGVVGVGKTTLLDLLQKELGYDTFLEPVTDNPLLDKFYYDRKRYAFPLQIFFLNQRFKMLKEAEKFKHPTLMDRSIYGDVIFAHLLNVNKEMADDEFRLYVDLLTNMLDHIQPPRLMIYLQTTTDNALTKIKRRGRDYEQIVEFDYWDNLNKEYEAYFSAYNLSPLLTINVDNRDFLNNPEDRQYVIDAVKAELGLV